MDRSLLHRVCDVVVVGILLLASTVSAADTPLFPAQPEAGLSSDSANTESHFRIGVSKSPLSAPFYVAQSLGYFEAEGLTVYLRDCLGGHRCMQSMLRGEVEYATCSDMVIMQQASAAEPFYLLASFVSSADDSQLVVRRSAGIRRPADLVGKRIGYVKGTASQYFLDTYLLLSGIDPADNHLIALQPEEMPKALLQGDVDAISAWQPWSYLSQAQNPEDFRVLNVLKPYLVTFNLVGRVDQVNENPSSGVRLVRALVRAEQFIAQEPEKAREIVRNILQLEPQMLEAIWRNYQFRVELDQSLLVTLQNEYYWLKHVGPEATGEGRVVDVEPLNFMPYIHANTLKALDINRVGILP